MCIEEFEEVSGGSGTGYKVFTEVEGKLYGEFTSGISRTPNRWLKEQYFRDTRSRGRIIGSPSNIDWPFGWMLFRRKHEALKYYNSRYIVDSNIATLPSKSPSFCYAKQGKRVIKKVQFRKQAGRANTAYFGQVPLIIAKEIYIVGGAV